MPPLPSRKRFEFFEKPPSETWRRSMGMRAVVQIGFFMSGYSLEAVTRAASYCLPHTEFAYLSRAESPRLISAASHFLSRSALHLLSLTTSRLLSFKTSYLLSFAPMPFPATQSSSLPFPVTHIMPVATTYIIPLPLASRS